MKISKAMSFVLRHGAVKEGLAVDQRGFVNVQDLVGFFLPIVLWKFFFFSFFFWLGLLWARGVCVFSILCVVEDYR